MGKFTFIFEYKGGTYIKQIAAKELTEAVNILGQEIGPEIPKFGKKKKSRLINEIQTQVPTPLTGLENVWFLHLELGKYFGHLNIVATLTNNVD